MTVHLQTLSGGHRGLRASRAVVAPDINAIDPQEAPRQLGAEDRQRLAEQWGYRQIGAELPDNVSLSKIVQTLPKEVGRKRHQASQTEATAFSILMVMPAMSCH